MPRHEYGINPQTGLGGVEQARELKRLEILSGANRFSAFVRNPYSELEESSWLDQRQQAEAVLAGGTLAEDATLAVLAAKDGVTVEIFARRVLANVERAKLVVNTIVPQQQAYEKQLKAAQTMEAITAIIVNYTPPEGLGL